ncbi:MAG: hypothetical protein ACFFEK_11040 [Candidatus Thorarchaeota archaeon]
MSLPPTGGAIELSEQGPICSESLLHGFAVFSNSCLSAAYPYSTYEKDVREEEMRDPLSYKWSFANAFTFGA